MAPHPREDPFQKQREGNLKKRKKCQNTQKTTKQAISELGCDATLIKEEDLLKIMEYNILSLPALVIDGKVISAGKRLSLSEVKELITK